MFATNHLGPFLLTNLLLNRLKEAPSARVITLSAPSTTRLDFTDLQGERHFSAYGAFGASKTANILFTYEPSRRLDRTNVTANILHPGLVKSNLMRDAPTIIQFVSRLVSRAPEHAGRTVTYLATSPEVENVTGQFLKGKRVSESSLYSRNPENQKKLWEISAKLTGLAA